jgi:ATP synthase protein I
LYAIVLVLSKKKSMTEQDLESRIKDAQSKLAKEDNDTNNHSSVGGRLIIDLIAGIIVGGFLGYYLDGKFDTKPWLTIILLILGSFGGLYTFYKDLNRR